VRVLPSSHGKLEHCQLGVHSMVQENKRTLTAHGAFALTGIRGDPVADTVLCKSQSEHRTIMSKQGQDIPCENNVCTLPL
jgi:hypothetical protein